jgi:hypothetical protein
MPGRELPQVAIRSAVPSTRISTFIAGPSSKAQPNGGDPPPSLLAEVGASVTPKGEKSQRGLSRELPCCIRAPL